MKKYIVASVIAVALFVGISQARAVTFDDLWREIISLKQQVVELKSQLGATVLRSGATLDVSKTNITSVREAPTVDLLPVTPSLIPVAVPTTSVAIPSIKTTETVVTPIVSNITTATTADASWYCQQYPQDPACVSAVSIQPISTSFSRNLAFGEKNEEVKKLQLTLIAKGYLSSDSATGFYGNGTAAALQKFQTSVGIASDGRAFGPQTQAAFNGNGGAQVQQAGGTSFGNYPPGCTSWQGYSPTTGLPCSPVGVPVAPNNLLPCSTTNATPQIKVLSPNGGEVYQVGQQITVKWSTCNIPATAYVDIYLTFQGQGGIQGHVLNTGTYTFTAQPITTGGLTILGLNYKVLVRMYGAMTEDYSDNLFAINGAQQSCSINTPVIVTSGSTTSQYVAAGTVNGVVDATQVTYQFSSSQPATISELKFLVGGPNTVTSVKVNGIVAPVVGGVAWLQGLNIPITQFGGGTNVTAYVSYSPVGISNLPSNTQSMINLTSAKVICGSTSSVVDTTASGASEKMFVVGSKPIVTVNTSSNSGLNLYTENKIGEVTVAADSHGNIKINDIVFNSFSSNINAVGYLAPRIADGSTTIGFSTCAFTGQGTFLCEFGSSSNTDYDGYVIAAGTSKTFNLFATVTGTAANNQAVVGTSLSYGGFNWDDMATNGTSGTDLKGFHIYGFPTGTYSIHQ